MHRESGTLYPTAPGTLAGEYDENIYEFKNASFSSIKKDFNRFQRTLKKLRGGKPFKVLLTVSPVPLTATASGKHVLPSTSYSKSTLRAVAGVLSNNQKHIDYFPSYEIVTNPRMHSIGFADNLRSVRDETVEVVMKHFFAEHPKLEKSPKAKVKTSLQSAAPDDTLIQCEDELLDAFGK